jgi:predicted O-methyltransferase YrrM
MVALFVVAAFLAAALLFVVQPLAGKPLLTLAGGSPSVWTSAMLFFQAALLLGYAVAHFLAAPHSAGRGASRRWIAIGVLAIGAGIAIFAPVPVSPAGADIPPVLWVLATLAAWVGAPFVAMATLSPLLQHWFSLTTHPRARDPYFLSVASNLGSAAGLLAYPFVVERMFTQGQQWKWWGIAMACLLVFVGACALLARGREAHPQANAPDPLAPAVPSRRGDVLRWIVLAFIPSSLMLGLTQHITTDIAPVPLLWVLPLLLYLLTFALAFTPEGPRPRWWQDAVFWSRAIIIPLLTLTLAMLLHARTPVLLVLAMHVFVFFAGAMLCHRRLALLRPAPSRLTAFYFAIAIGGVLGGIANAILAPLVFDRILEYPLALAALIGARFVAAPQSAPALKASSMARWLGAALVPAALVVGVAALNATLELSRTLESALVAGVPTLALGLLFFFEASKPGIGPRAQTPRWALPLALAGALVAGEYTSSQRPTLHQERTFFGVHRVERTPDDRFHVLLHGTTAHGIQAAPTHPEFERLRTIPGAYYHPGGPVGSLLASAQAARQSARVALVGLGTGAIASYARPSDQFTFFEIDPSVVAIAQNPSYFTYLSDAQARGATLRAVVGDGRHTLASEPEGSFDLIVIDAFSSDAIPTHLLTREAIELYLSRLAPGGVLALHISNRAFNLAPVLCRYAQDLRLAALDNDDVVASRQQVEEGKSESWWFALARDPACFDGLRANNVFWRTPTDLARTDLPLWTDQRSDVLSVLIW